MLLGCIVGEYHFSYPLLEKHASDFEGLQMWGEVQYGEGGMANEQRLAFFTFLCGF